MSEPTEKAWQEYQRGNEVARVLTAALRGTGLTYVQAKALEAVADGVGRAQPMTIAEQLGVQSQATTSLIDQLERGGLIVRRRDLVDRRAVRLETTPEGDLQLTVAKAILAHAAEELYGVACSCEGVPV